MGGAPVVAAATKISPLKALRIVPVRCYSARVMLLVMLLSVVADNGCRLRMRWADNG